MAAEELSVRGLTGVDVILPIAGAGTRAYAFLIDWHIRVLLILAWFLIGALLASFGFLGTGASGARWRMLISPALSIPALSLYFLYHPVLELLLRGRTPGKRMAGARIVTVEGATPSSMALLMRNLFRLVDSLPVFYLLGIGFCLFTTQRVRIGDLAAGTVLVVDGRAGQRSLDLMGELVQQTRVEPAAAALVADLLERWTELAPRRRMQLAGNLLERLDGGIRPGESGVFDEAQMRARLQRLLGRA